MTIQLSDLTDEQIRSLRDEQKRRWLKEKNELLQVDGKQWVIAGISDLADKIKVFFDGVDVSKKCTEAILSLESGSENITKGFVRLIQSVDQSEEWLPYLSKGPCIDIIEIPEHHPPFDFGPKYSIRIVKEFPQFLWFEGRVYWEWRDEDS
jgi:hypothetical protein